jgi:hypothetical protein
MTVGWLPRLSALTACGMNKKARDGRSHAGESSARIAGGDRV